MVVVLRLSNPQRGSKTCTINGALVAAPTSLSPHPNPRISAPPQILIRLRQAVDHPYLVIYSATKREGMTPAMNSPASQTPATSSAQPATAPSQGSPPARFSAPMPIAVVGGTNGKPSSRATRASRTDSSGGGGGCGDGDSPHNKEGGAAGALGDTSSDSESDGVEAATGKSGAIGSAVEPVAGDEGDSDEEDMDACGICSEPAERPVSSSCGHSFCRTWWVDWLSFRPLFSCVTRSGCER